MCQVPFKKQQVFLLCIVLSKNADSTEWVRKSETHMSLTWTWQVCDSWFALRWPPDTPSIGSPTGKKAFDKKG